MRAATIAALVVLGLVVGAEAQFDWGKASCDAKRDNTFTKKLATDGQVAELGTIPTGKWAIEIQLTCDTDVDIQLFDADDVDSDGDLRPIIAWCPSGDATCKGCPEGTTTCLGGLSTAHEISYQPRKTEKNPVTTPMRIAYSGYNGKVGPDGKQNRLGDEWIRIEGETTRNLMMKLFAYKAGDAKVQYGWGRPQTTCCLGTGPCESSFEFQPKQNDVKDLGPIPAGKKDIFLSLESAVDLDLKLLDEDIKTSNFPKGQPIVAWCPDTDTECQKAAVLGAAQRKASATYKSLKYIYSGYAPEDANDGPGDDLPAGIVSDWSPGAGNEYIIVNGQLNTNLYLQVFAYKGGKGTAKIQYFEVVDQPDVVKPPSDISVTYVGNTQPGSEVNFTATAGGGSAVKEWRWEFAALLREEKTSEVNTLSVVFGEAGEETLTVTAVNDGGVSAPVTIKLPVDSPIRNLKTNYDSTSPARTIEVEPHKRVAFEASVAEGTNVGYTWTFGKTEHGTEKTATAEHTWPEVGEFTATVIAKNSVSTLTADIKVIVKAQALLAENLEVQFLVSPVPVRWPSIMSANYKGSKPEDRIRYFWDFQGHNVGSGCTTDGGITEDNCEGQVVEKTYMKTGTYTVTLTAENSQGTVTKNFDIVVAPDTPSMKVAKRKELRSMTDAEWNKVRDALWKLKEVGVYDHLVHLHYAAARFRSSTDSSRNAAHRGPAFLPWHRVFLKVFERALQHAGTGVDGGADYSIGVPYWRWGIDREIIAKAGGLPEHYGMDTGIWNNKRLGPNGDPEKNYEVTSGPFCSVKTDTCEGKWPLKDIEGYDVLRHALGRPDVDINNLSTHKHVYDLINGQGTYDVYPFDGSSSRKDSFRNNLEGWTSAYGRAHNGGHVFVGGSMMPFTSPNSPIFYFNHAMTDLVWYLWQVKNTCYEGCYRPRDSESRWGKFRVNCYRNGAIKKDGECVYDGHHWSSEQYPWKVRVRDVADESNSLLGYEYEWDDTLYDPDM